MKKVYLANESSQTTGGGWSFISNIKLGLKDNVAFVDNVDDCDIYFISGATMVTRNQVVQAKSKGKKIVLRVDNIPRDSRNRNTGTSRLRDFAKLADLIIYQSKWCKEYVGGWLKRDGAVIINGVDTSVFNPNGNKVGKMGSPQYIYVRFNRDENKRWEEAWYHYQMISRRNPNASLWIVGKFSPEQIEYNFDFYNKEKFSYWGIVKKEMMATLLRSADVLLYPYYNDACSNTLLEAMASGIEIDVLDSGLSGGSPEILKCKDTSLERMSNEYLKEFEKI